MMMSVREDKKERKIFYKCTNVACLEEDRTTTRNLISQPTIKSDSKRQLHIYRPELACDKTLATAKAFCKSCNRKRKVVLFLGGSGKAKDDNVELVYMCTECKKPWIQKAEDAKKDGATSND